MNPAILESLLSLGNGALGGLISGPLSILNGFIMGGKEGAGSMRNAITQQGLTGAQREQNAFNAEQAQISRDFSEMQRQTQYQTAVNDMTAAGLNPAMMYQGAGQAASPTPSAQASGTAPQGHSISDMLSMLTTLSQLNLTEAQADLFKNEASGVAIDNEYKPQMNEARLGEISANTENLLSAMRRNDSEVILNGEKVNTEKVIQDFNRAGMNKAKAEETLILLQASGQAITNAIASATSDEQIRLYELAVELRDANIAFENAAAGEKEAAAAEAYAAAEKYNAETSGINAENIMTQNQSEADETFKKEHPRLYMLRKSVEKSNLLTAGVILVGAALTAPKTLAEAAGNTAKRAGKGIQRFYRRNRHRGQLNDIKNDVRKEAGSPAFTRQNNGARLK